MIISQPFYFFKWAFLPLSKINVKITHTLVIYIAMQELYAPMALTYTLARDYIHCYAMITYQACGLDKKIDKSKLVDFFGVPDWIRTNDTKRRRLVLYPAELRIRIQSYSILALFMPFCKRFALRFLFSTKKSAKRALPIFPFFSLRFPLRLKDGCILQTPRR